MDRRPQQPRCAPAVGAAGHRSWVAWVPMQIGICPCWSISRASWRLPMPPSPVSGTCLGMHPWCSVADAATRRVVDGAAGKARPICLTPDVASGKSRPTCPTYRGVGSGPALACQGRFSRSSLVAGGHLSAIVAVLSAFADLRICAGLEQDDDVGSPEEEVSELIAFERVAADGGRHIDG